MRTLLTHSYSDAPVSAAQKRFPVLVFAPGFDQLPLTYADLVEDIASHGYIVAGIVVTHFGPVAVFPDGRVVLRANPNPQALGYRDQDDFVLNFAAPTWAADMRFVLNQLGKLNGDSSSMFKGRLDMSHVGTFGHSFGGSTAAQVALEDSRVKAAIDIDGKIYGAITQKRLGKPFLLVLSVSRQRADFERLAPDDPARRQYETMEQDFNFIWKGAKPGFKLSLPGTAHMFSSDAALVPSISPGMQKMLAGSLDVKRVHYITKAYVEAFFDRYLKGKPSLLLIKPSVEFPEATFETGGH
jgi:dienelactone hydrolase